eukprot:GSChrysophyteH1.ASY1.ANO1.532.1 assembled CDS
MSSLRNAVKRVTHKERAQPAARKRFGLLEKHKDYVERAQDYHKKQDYLKVLEKKAAERNPDEFYFKMNKSQVNKKGVHKEKRDGSLDQSTVKLLKTQDMGYIMNKKVIDEKKVKKLQSSLHLIGEDQVGRKKKHKIFVDSEEEQRSFDAAAHLDTRLSDEALPSAQQVKKALDKRDKAYKEMQARARRAEKLDSAMHGLQHQRNMMGKGAKRKVSTSQDEKDSNKTPQYKWKRVRAK